MKKLLKLLKHAQLIEKIVDAINGIDDGHIEIEETIKVKKGEKWLVKVVADRE